MNGISCRPWPPSTSSTTSPPEPSHARRCSCCATAESREIKDLLAKLKIEPHALLRKKEKAYKAAGLGPDATAAQVAKAIAAEPLLLERPVVVKGAKAVIGRPTEAIEALL
ncbi:MAG: ArsC/Spx/MgsR family protein [Planctomycetota bacterium]